MSPGLEHDRAPHGKRHRVVVLGSSFAGLIALLLVVGLLSVASPAYAVNPATVHLGTAGTYSVLGGTGVTNTGETTLSGDLGLSSSGDIAGFPPGIVSGIIHDKDAAAVQAQADTLAAYNNAAGRTADNTFSGDQNGVTFVTGVYSTSAAFALTGTMYLDGQNNPNAVFIFNVDAALNTAAASNVSLINGAQPGNVFWRVNGAVGIGATSNFSGTIMANGAVTIGADTSLNGRALATGLVTLSTNTITTTSPTTVPGAPTGVAGSSGNGQVVVSWLAPVSDGGAAITAYTVTASPGGRTCGWSSGALSCTVTGLTNGTSYTFTVTATNAVGTSNPSGTSGAVTPATVPGAPTSVSATAGNAQAVVSWSAPVSDGGAVISAYMVTASPGGETCEWSSGALSCTVTGLTNGTAYTFTVTATNSVGSSSASTASAAVTPATVPGAPTSVTGSAGDERVHVSWSAPASNGGATITAYTVTASPGGGTCEWSSGALLCTVTGLTDGTAYTFTVTATNAVGSSSPSSASSAVTPATVPGVPTNASATAGNAQAVVSWSAPASNGGSTITAYMVTASPGGRTCGWSSGALSCTVTGLTNGTSYTFTVTATNAVGSSSPSPTSDAVTPATLPGAPTSVTGSSGDEHVHVSWFAPVSNGGAAITAYTVTASPGGRTCGWSSGPLSCTVTGLTNGTSYTFTVTATNSAGTSSAGTSSASSTSAANSAGTSSASSPSAAVTPATLPGAPTSVDASSGNGQVVVSWLAPVSNGGAAITAYTATASPGGRTCGLSSGPLSCTITGLTNGTHYTFTVTATNAAGTSSPSPADDAVPRPPPLTVGTFQAHLFKAGVHLTSWATVSSAGKITQTITTGSGKKKKTWCRVTKTAKAAGSYKQSCNLGAKARKHLRRNNLKLTTTTTLRPLTGAAVTKRIKVVILRRSYSVAML